MQLGVGPQENWEGQGLGKVCGEKPGRGRDRVLAALPVPVLRALGSSEELAQW